MLFIHIFCPCIYVFFIVLSSFGFISQSSIKPIFTISTQHFFFFVKFYKRIYIWDIIIFHIRWLSRNILYIHQRWHLIYLHFIFVYLYYQIFKHFPNKKTIFFSHESGKQSKNVFLCRLPYNMQLVFFYLSKILFSKEWMGLGSRHSLFKPSPYRKVKVFTLQYISIILMFCNWFITNRKLNNVIEV